MNIMPGKTVFISGGTGSLGAMAIPIAKSMGLNVITNGEFAARMGMPTMKQFLFGLAGSKYDRMAAKNKQKYYFVFVREDGAGLKRISEIFGNRKIETSVDKIYELSEVNGALAKVAGGGSKGKTILKIS